MKGEQIELFITLAGNTPAEDIETSSESLRSLGAGLILSETLEYITRGLGLKVYLGDTEVKDPQNLKFTTENTPSPEQMLDGLADIAYTMYWNALMFQLPLEEAFESVCENNLEKFVKVESKEFPAGKVSHNNWHLGKNIKWPSEVCEVSVIETTRGSFAVGKDMNGKVRKPSTYPQLSLTPLLKKTLKARTTSA